MICKQGYSFQKKKKSEKEVNTQKKKVVLLVSSLDMVVYCL